MLYRGKFGEHTSDIKKFYEEYAHIAALWQIKLNEFSEQGKNLVIASYGRHSTWKIPSWWRWAIREIDLFKRSLDIIVYQLQRGEKGQLLLPSGKPISKALGYVDSTKALVENGTSWECENCKMTNSGTANFCSNCGKKKPL
jgi:hypothetical protein